MSIVLFSNVKSPTSLLIHIMVSHVCGREGVCGVRVVVCLSLSLCLGNKLDFLSEAQSGFQLKCFHNHAGSTNSYLSLLSPQVHVLPFSLQSWNSEPSQFQVHGICGIYCEPSRQPSATRLLSRCAPIHCVPVLLLQIWKFTSES